MTDFFIAIILSLCVVVFCVVMVYAGRVATSSLQEQAPNLQNAMGDDVNVSEIIGSTMGKVSSSFESLKWISGMIIVGLFLAILISNAFVRTHPAFFVAYFLVWVLAIVFSVEMSIAYTSAVSLTSGDIANIWGEFTASNFIFGALPIWVILVGGAGAVLLYVNFRRRDEFGF